MSHVAEPLPERTVEALRFLERDFNQAFAEKRRCEDLAWDVCKFSFTATSAAVALAVSAERYSRERTIDLTPAAEAILGIGLILGLFLFGLLLRNRVYFVLAARYINSHRAAFLAEKPMGIDPGAFYTTADKPPFYSWTSTQSWAIHFVALLNGAQGATLSYLLMPDWTGQTRVAAISLLIAFVTQAAVALRYLSSKEGKPPEQAVFGRQRGT